MNNISNLKPQVSDPQDTICAPATAPGGALAVIRVSGPSAFSAVSALCSIDCAKCAAEAPRTALLVKLYSPLPQQGGAGEGQLLDEALVTLFPAPHSYTGEDSAELSCHGSPYIVSRVLALLCEHGCRMARPGEFTQRAYLNGKLDLSQAEAVADLIASSNAATHRLAMSQLRGGVSSQLATLREQLLRLTALLELELDFSDHEDLEFADRTQLLTLARTIDEHVNRLARSFETGQALKKGIPVAIVGRTNVGKSTLLNALLHDDRAIVSDIHGTTRDTIEDTTVIHGVTFRFIDTAGLRDTADRVEQIGIERTYNAIEKARIVIWLFDQPPTKEEAKEMEARTQGKSLLPVLNKIDQKNVEEADCPPFTANHPLLKVSAKHGIRLDRLIDAIYDAACLPSQLREGGGMGEEDDIIITSARQHEALTRAHADLSRVIASLHSSLSADLIAEDLRLVIDDLAQVTGQERIIPSEVLSSIFEHFCVGK